MIIFFDGSPGSGKSYDAVRRIVDNLKTGKRVYTNIDGMDKPECREAISLLTGLSDEQMERNLIALKNEQVPYFWNYVEPQSLIVIDEAQKYFNVREWQTDKNNEFGAWASTHRHYGFNVFLLTVNLDRVDSSVRQLAEWTYRYRKANFFGDMISNKYVLKSYVGDDVKGKPFAKSVKSYDKKLFKCYESYSMKDIKEVGVMKHANVFNHPIFYAIPVTIVIFIILFMRSGIVSGDFFGAKRFQAAQDKTAVSVEVPGALPIMKSDGTVELPKVAKVEGKVNQGGSQQAGSAPVEGDKKLKVEGNGQIKGQSGANESRPRGDNGVKVEQEIKQAVKTAVNELKIIGKFDGKVIKRNSKGKVSIETNDNEY